MDTKLTVKKWHQVTLSHSPLFIVLLMRIHAQSILLAQEHFYSINETSCMNCIDLHLKHFYMYIWASCKCMNVHGVSCFVVYTVVLCYLHMTGKIKDSNSSIKSTVKAVLLPELQIITETEHLVNNTDKEKTEEERLSGSLIEYTCTVD